MLYKGMEMCGRNFSLSEIGDVLACISTTTGVMDEWMPRADSAHQIGLKLTFHAVLIIGWGCYTRGWKCVAGIFHSQKLAMFWLVSPPPPELWTNGCHERIQHIKLVLNPPSTLF